MLSDTKKLLGRILEVFEKYDKTNIASDFTDVPLVDLVTEDAISIAGYFSITDGSVSEEETAIFNRVFGTQKTPEEINSIITDNESIMNKIGYTFNIIAETEKLLGIYYLRKTMIVPLIKFFESFAMDIIKSENSQDSELEEFNLFFSKIESVLETIPME